MIQKQVVVARDSALVQQRSILTRVDTIYIPSPVPQRYADLVSAGLGSDTTGMEERTEMGPWGSAKIYTFPTSQDMFVSGTVNKGTSWDGDHVAQALRQWKKQGGGKGNFLDVGANIGTYALTLASAIKETGRRVIAIEAMPPILKHLQAGVVANKAENVVLFPYAIGEPVQVDEVEMALNPTNKGGSTVVGNKPWSQGAAEKFSVGLTTLDSMLVVAQEELSNVFYAKVDIEGNEGRALAGGQELFSKYPPCVLFIELVPGFLSSAGTSVEKVKDMLTGYGYDSLRAKPEGSYNWEFWQKDFDKCVSRLQ